MGFENEQPTAASELRNKEETELPVGVPGDPEGRASAMWRCGECGEMGRLEADLPSECPTCTAPRENLYYWEED